MSSLLLDCYNCYTLDFLGKIDRPAKNDYIGRMETKNAFQVFVEWGRQGGLKAAKAMTAEARIARAKKAGSAKKKKRVDKAVGVVVE